MLDAIAETFPAEWKVSSPELVAETATSRIVKVRLEDGAPAIVKHLTPLGMREELGGTRYLEWHDGKGCIRLLAQRGNNLLLEYAGARTLLDHLNEHGDDAATQVFVEMFLELSQTKQTGRPAPQDLIPLRTMFSGLFTKAEGDRKRGVRSQFVEAAELADRLLNDQRDVQPLHGDLHHENILYGERGWLVIDPKGLMGDPMYDAANMFYNPLDRDDLRSSESRAFSMAQTFSHAFNRDITTILGFGMVHACLSASWHDEDGNLDESKRSIGVAEAIKRVLQTI
ncbi:aminoglycoside phosphotransferase family protein [Phyllobacterium endophyticum]|uniref:3'-kinase n=1 Tax=Phyllobacterium endophyticum TaxID=1149773 RepID=A0A2P7AWA5_9HYPH|nr:aminoglycoside phosphotransferase family protein [Phyllobacterium endophyticum]MBB3235093.1 streptomycin 6-kinase [Phyllobacterium endophyticum]PSH58489.1 3'-kinase [Phyllobacterium endophyticum]TYR39165.1 phosphotransferase [Phyllobacterium endophyticum]